MFHYVKPTVEGRPDEVIIHCGTYWEGARKVAERIVDLAHHIANDCNKVTISSLTPRSDSMNSRVIETNRILKQFANQNDWDFVDNSNITNAHLNKSGLHLNRRGTGILLENVTNHILSYNDN